MLAQRLQIPWCGSSSIILYFERRNTVKRSRYAPFVCAVLFSTTAFAGGLGIQTNLGAFAGGQLTSGTMLNVNGAVGNSVQAGVNGSLSPAVSVNTNLGGSANSSIGATSSRNDDANGTLNSTLQNSERTAVEEYAPGVLVDSKLIKARANAHERSLKNLVTAKGRSIEHDRAKVHTSETALINKSEQIEANAGEDVRLAGQAGARATKRAKVLAYDQARSAAVVSEHINTYATGHAQTTAQPANGAE